MTLFLRKPAPVAVCPHPLEENEVCGVCAPSLPISPNRCEDENCATRVDELEDPNVKFITLAKSCDTDLEYVNVQHHHFGSPYKVTKVLRGTEDGRVLISFWADNLREWLQCVVPLNYRLTTAPEYLAKAARPSLESPEARKERAAHLGAYRKVRAELSPEPSQPLNCIVGQIGPNKVLVDAGDGTVLGRYAVAGFEPRVEAIKLGRSVVKQAQATTYALTTLRRAWADAKGK